MSNMTKLSRIDYKKTEGRFIVDHVVLYDSSKITTSRVINMLQVDPRSVLHSPDLIDITLEQFNNIINPLLDAIKDLSTKEDTKNSVDSEVTIKIPSVCGTTVDMPISSMYAISSIFRSVMRDYEEDKKVQAKE